jgi:chromosome partitioning protein
MEKTAYTTADIQKIFRVEEKYKSPLSVLNAEERGEIPKASRIQRGKTSVRQWQTNQLPDIGKKFGFLGNCKEQQILNVFLSKGGVGKSSFCFNLARTLAISSVKKQSADQSKILIIGLDLQSTITDYTLPPVNVESLEEAQATERAGLYEVLFENVPLEDVILPTDLPNLFIIPENSSLNSLEKTLRFQTRKNTFSKINYSQNSKIFRSFFLIIRLIGTLSLRIALFVRLPSFHRLGASWVPTKPLKITPLISRISQRLFKLSGTIIF